MRVHTYFELFCMNMARGMMFILGFVDGRLLHLGGAHMTQYQNGLQLCETVFFFERKTVKLNKSLVCM